MAIVSKLVTSNLISRAKKNWVRLDIILPEMVDATKAQIEDAMQGHILAQTELIGTYQLAE